LGIMTQGAKRGARPFLTEQAQGADFQRAY